VTQRERERESAGGAVVFVICNIIQKYEDAFVNSHTQLCIMSVEERMRSAL
jgi:hypothetical protein